MSIRQKSNGSLAWALAIAVLVWSSVAQAHDDRHRSRVIPAGSIVEGKSIEEWTAEWWRWGLSFTEGQSPIFDDDTGKLGHLGDVGGPVFFFGAIANITRTFNVPCGKYLLYPLLTSVAWDDEEEALRQYNSEFIDPITALYASVDGKRVPHLFSHRETTQDLFSVTFPDGGLNGEVGGVFDAVSDGYWLMLAPLAPGRHTISLGGTVPDFEVDYRATMEIKVTGKCRDH
jgi:hypothetical protein